MEHYFPSLQKTIKLQSSYLWSVVPTIAIT